MPTDVPDRRLPWARPRHELVLLVLVALVALTPVSTPNVQDGAHLCLTQALLHGSLHDDACFRQTIDHSAYGGHLYSNKAPGLSLLALPAVLAVDLPALPSGWHRGGDFGLWAVHLFDTGIPFLLLVLIAGRMAEGLAPGWGAPTLVAFALGTLVSPLAVSAFAHVSTACFAVLAFALAWRRRPLAAGLAAGVAVSLEYEALLILLALLVYVVLDGRREALRFLLGAAPGLALVAAYDWAAFGSPFHNPLRYSDNEFSGDENAGVLGLHLPRLHASAHVLVGEKGLLVISPVLLAAAAGLVLLHRRGLRREAVLCAAITVAFTVAECGYFIPYGGGSPGPRFLTPALPFLALGLGPAFARFPRATAALAVLSIVATTTVTATWALSPAYDVNVWVELGRAVVHLGRARLADYVSNDILAWNGATWLHAWIPTVLAGAAAALALVPPLRRQAGAPQSGVR